MVLRFSHLCLFQKEYCFETPSKVCVVSLLFNILSISLDDNVVFNLIEKLKEMFTFILQIHLQLT